MAAGWHTVAVPEAKVYHAVGALHGQQLSNVKSPVSRRRYISDRASLVIIGCKYFTGSTLILSPLVWLAMALNNFAPVSCQAALAGHAGAVKSCLVCRPCSPIVGNIAN